MKKTKIRSEASLLSAKSDVQVKKEIYVPPLDELTVKVLCLQVSEDVPRHYAIKVTFFDQLLLTGIIEAARTRLPKMKTLAMGTMNYDPSDDEKMCLFADCPLIVHIQPIISVETIDAASSPTMHSTKAPADINCCNIDIVAMFIEKDKMIVTRRMEPLIKPTVLHSKSWDNLPLLTMELTVDRNKNNSHHHELLERANCMTLTLVGAFNLTYEDEYVYTAASKTPLHNETNTGLITYNQGYKIPKRFDPLRFYPKWESLRVGDDIFTSSNKKFVYDLEDIQNPYSIDLKYYLSEKLRSRVIIWGSFHRTLVLGSSEAWLEEHLRRYSWPFELDACSEQSDISFMAFLNLFHLLYPGEDTLRMAVPLQWVNAQEMQEACGCNLLMLTPDSMVPHATNPRPKNPLDAAQTSASTDEVITQRPTGADGNCAFIIVEVKLARPLKKAVIYPSITSSEITAMLQECEQGLNKRECTGRGQLNSEWQSTVQTAERLLQRIPQYGMTEFCAFNRQLSETKTRVELMTSCWLEAAVYVNNNFVVQEFLRSDETFEEMLMMSHACLTRLACSTFAGTSNQKMVDTTLTAARHARHMQNTSHALDLYLQVVVNNPRRANSWRELSTCLRDVDRGWANVCINKALVLDPRHPLSLVAKGSILYEEDPEAAEPFFVTLLSLYPFWLTGWVIASAYYMKMELFQMADQIMTHMRQSRAEGLVEDIGGVRAWEHELGDWWDHTPLLPAMNPYYEATDLLLRLRAISLAETCLSRAIAEAGESAVSSHLLALCCRLRGDVDDALCHLQQGIDKFGDLSYLRSLQAECLHKKNDTPAATASFQKAGSCLGVYSTLLSIPCWEPTRARSLLLDLIRRHPSAYAWIALAEDWMQRAAVYETRDGVESTDTSLPEGRPPAKTCAAACAVQALKYDRQAGRAWTILTQLVAPSARRHHCQKMAKMCHFATVDGRLEKGTDSQQSTCHLLGQALRECRCFMCHHLQF